MHAGKAAEGCGGNAEPRITATSNCCLSYILHIAQPPACFSSHRSHSPASLPPLCSVVMCQAFGQAAFPVDTHIHRLAQRWGLTDGKSVEQTESDLKALFQEALWKELHLQVSLGQG